MYSVLHDGRRLLRVNHASELPAAMQPLQTPAGGGWKVKWTLPLDQQFMVTGYDESAKIVNTLRDGHEHDLPLTATSTCRKGGIGVLWGEKGFEALTLQLRSLIRTT